ncbi:hypothetical protein NIB75_00355 [Bacteroides uniformis]|nr:hypothetical protein [Bacteroides uniformis]
MWQCVILSCRTKETFCPHCLQRLDDNRFRSGTHPWGGEWRPRLSGLRNVRPTPMPAPIGVKAFNGLAQVLLQSTGEAGEATLTVVSENLPETSCVLKLQK